MVGLLQYLVEDCVISTVVGFPPKNVTHNEQNQSLEMKSIFFNHPYRGWVYASTTDVYVILLEWLTQHLTGISLSFPILGVSLWPILSILQFSNSIFFKRLILLGNPSHETGSCLTWYYITKIELAFIINPMEYLQSEKGLVTQSYCSRSPGMIVL